MLLLDVLQNQANYTWTVNTCMYRPSLGEQPLMFRMSHQQWLCIYIYDIVQLYIYIIYNYIMCVWMTYLQIDYHAHTWGCDTKYIHLAVQPKFSKGTSSAMLLSLGITNPLSKALRPPELQSFTHHVPEWWGFRSGCNLDTAWVQ